MRPRHLLIATITSATLLACHSHTHSAAKTVTDSTTITAVIPAPTQQKTTTIPPTASADSVEGSARELQGFYNDYIASYTNRCVIDSSFQLGTDHFTIHIQDSCLMDSAIVIPKKYVHYYRLDSFVTHNFISKIRLEKNGTIILSQALTRQDFDAVLFEALQQYATLRCPHLRLTSSSIELAYSISIPLTDVGMQAIADIDAKGHLLFKTPGPEK
jgi:hypothetical protein